MLICKEGIGGLFYFLPRRLGISQIIMERNDWTLMITSVQRDRPLKDNKKKWKSSASLHRQKARPIHCQSTVLKRPFGEHVLPANPPISSIHLLPGRFLVHVCPGYDDELHPAAREVLKRVELHLNCCWSQVHYKLGWYTFKGRSYSFWSVASFRWRHLCLASFHWRVLQIEWYVAFQPPIYGKNMAVE